MGRGVARYLLALATLSALACAGSKREPPSEPAKTEARPQPEQPEEATDSEDASEADIDLREDAATPSSAVTAPPERRPSGAFDLCGDKCRDSTDMKRSLGAEDER